MKRAGITQEAVAIAATVSRTHVNHVLHDRATSRKVIETAERLTADVEASRSAAELEAIAAGGA